jgi:hypothetical protein
MHFIGIERKARREAHHTGMTSGPASRRFFPKIRVAKCTVILSNWY